MRLLNLPRDILLYLTDFFTECEAFPLLVVSSQFHDLFARAVWHVFRIKIFELDPVTRSAALARYGHLARLIIVRKHTGIPLMYPPNWHLKLPHVVGFCFAIDNRLGAEFRRRIFVGIRSLINLHRLIAHFEFEEAPYTADGLASIILARHRDATKRKLIEVSLMIRDQYGSSPWDVCVRLFKKMSPLNIPKLVVSGYPVTAMRPPSVAQCHTLAPCLFTLAPYALQRFGTCASQVNGRYFNDKSVMFPRVESLILSLCCHRTEVFDPNCVTPERFTSLQQLHIYEAEACEYSIEDFKTACLAIGTMHWPNLTQIKLRAMIDQAGLERIFRANPQLTEFTLMYQPDHFEFHGSIKHIVKARLNLYWLMNLLPKLRYTSIFAPASLRLDYTPQTASGDILGRYLGTVEIDGCSVLPNVLAWLLLLPKLRKASIKNTVLIDPKSALKLIQRIHKKHIQRRSHQSVHLAFPDVILSEECSQVLVEWVAAMPTLKYVCEADVALCQKIYRRCPHLKFMKYKD